MSMVESSAKGLTIQLERKSNAVSRIKSTNLSPFLFFVLFLIGIIPNSVSAQCDNNLRREAYKSLGNGTYLRDIKVNIPDCNPKKPTVDEKTMMMNKGSRYRFVLQSDPTKPGKPAIRIFDQFTDYINVDKGTPSTVFDFMCNKTQVYYISVYFQDGKDGCCIVMMGLMESK